MEKEAEASEIHIPGALGEGPRAVQPEDQLCPSREKVRPAFFPEWDWEKKILEYIARYDGVYADFANSPGDWYYGHLKTLIDESPDREKLRSRILFGSDFPINLLDVDSCNEYLQCFDRTPHFTDGDKDLFRSVNPEMFLFHHE